jgi:hypothetical protein
LCSLGVKFLVVNKQINVIQIQILAIILTLYMVRNAMKR